MKHVRPRTVLAALAVTVALALSGCSASSSAAPAASAPASAGAEDASWPRTVTHEQGELTLDAAPQRIVSTTPSVTGTLLAIGAPVVASAATAPGTAVADEDGFFRQWGDVARERGVEVLYPNLELDLEAIISAEPDLVVVSTSGADSVLDQYEQIAELFPTVVVNYSDKSWQDLATDLGEITGHEDGAADAIADFDAYVAEAADSLTVPDGPVSVVSYNGPTDDSAVAKETSPWAGILGDLGLEVVGAPDALDTSEQVRQDVAWVSFENLTAAITGTQVWLLSGTPDDVAELTAEPTLQNLEAVTTGQVFDLGPTSFRLDYYSATALVDTVVGHLG